MLSMSKEKKEPAKPEEPVTPKVGKIAAAKGLAKSAFSYTEKLASWAYLIPLLIIIGAMAYLCYTGGLRWVYIGAFVGGIFVWNYWGKRMTIKDQKLVLEVNIENQILNAYRVSRKCWARCSKNAENKPTLNFITKGGISVELVKEFDPNNNRLVYPVDKEYTDLRLAMMPELISSIIDDLHQTKKKLTDMELQKDVKALEEARAYIAKLEDMLRQLILGGDPPKETP